MNEHAVILQPSTTRLGQTLALAAVAAPLLYLFLPGSKPYPGDVVLKTSMCVLLALIAWRAQARLLALALAFSAAGDAFLGLDGERLFVPGLASFLITHVLYSVLFVHIAKTTRAPASLARKAAMAITPLFALAFSAVLWPELGGLALPVALYMLAIVSMALLSLRIVHWAVPTGATLFVISDSLIALGKFLWSAPWIGPAIWITYALAQLLIVHGLVRLRSEGRTT